MTFEDNKAFAGGGALYVNDISPCGYTSTVQNQTDTNTVPSFNHSVLALPQFTYRYNKKTLCMYHVKIYILFQ